MNRGKSRPELVRAGGPGEENGSSCSMGTEFLLGVMKCFENGQCRWL